jgi:hypothetical protein
LYNFCRSSNASRGPQFFGWWLLWLTSSKTLMLT